MKAGCVTRAALVVALACVSASNASAEEAWVKGEVTLNLRSGAGGQFRIIGTATTGDRLSVLAPGKNWTRVRTADGIDGFIPAGYLDDEPPPTMRLVQLESEVERLSADLASSTEEASELRTRSDGLAQSDETQKDVIQRLEKENLQLRAGARWPEWITGALILSTGMVLGAVLRGVSGRRRGQRIRL